MQHLNAVQTADYLEGATVDRTIEAGHAIVHMGMNAAGARFVMVNDCFGETVITESL